MAEKEETYICNLSYLPAFPALSSFFKYYTSMHPLHLSGRKTCERVKTSGALWKGKHMQIRWLKGAPRNLGPDAVKEGIYVGTVASARLDASAVRRNRMRRRCREALRLALKKTAALPSHQLLLLPRSSSLRCDFEELSTDASIFLTSITR
jgi:ribonuclease P protein component